MGCILSLAGCSIRQSSRFGALAGCVKVRASFDSTGRVLDVKVIQSSAGPALQRRRSGRHSLHPMEASHEKPFPRRCQYNCAGNIHTASLSDATSKHALQLVSSLKAR